mmetsp:Transcript_7230/g.20380  ORF Transcript_7230/g.20380 Transcript_7230/m.20380 type:complete len:199 (+) Transcript_7230:1625-2221(+)
MAPLVRLGGDGVLRRADAGAWLPPSCRRVCWRRELGEPERCRASELVRSVCALTTILRVEDCILLLKDPSTTTRVGDCAELPRRTSVRDPLNWSLAPALVVVLRALIGADCCGAAEEQPFQSRVPLALVEVAGCPPRGLPRARSSGPPLPPEHWLPWPEERCRATDLRCGKVLPSGPGDLRWAGLPLPGLVQAWECLL